MCHTWNNCRHSIRNFSLIFFTNLNILNFIINYSNMSFIIIKYVDNTFQLDNTNTVVICIGKLKDSIPWHQQHQSLLVPTSMLDNYYAMEPLWGAVLKLTSSVNIPDLINHTFPYMHTGRKGNNDSKRWLYICTYEHPYMITDYHREQAGK